MHQQNIILNISSQLKLIKYLSGFSQKSCCQKKHKKFPLYPSNFFTTNLTLFPYFKLNFTYFIIIMQKPYLFRKQPTQQLEIINRVSMQIDNPVHPCIVPEHFLQNIYENNGVTNKSHLIYCPMPSRKIHHSPQIEQMLTKSPHGTINCSNDIFWCFQEYKLVIWFGQNGGNINFSPVESIFDEKISSVTISELSPFYDYSEKLFNQNITLVCIAFGPLIHFYSLVQKKILEPLHITINTTYTCIIEMILKPKVIRKSELPLFYVDVNGRVGYFNILRMKKYSDNKWQNFIFDSLLKVKSDTSVTKMLASEDKIYLLMNKYTRQNKFKSYLYNLIGKSQSSIPIIITTIIQQYQWNQSIGIKFRARTNSEKLAAKLENSFQQFLSQPDLKNMDIDLNISSIHLENNRLKIILLCGFSIEVDSLSRLSFYDKLKGMPSPALYSLLQDVNQKKILNNVNILMSTQNAIITKDKIYVQDRQWLHIGDLAQKQPLCLIKASKPETDHFFLEPTRWILITKSYYRIFWQLTPRDVIMTLLSAYFEAKNFNEITDNVTQRLQQKIDKLFRVIGDVNIISNLINLLSEINSYKLIISNDVYNHFYKVLLEKNIQSGTITGEKQLEITKQIEQYLWMKIQQTKNRKINQKWETKNQNLLYNGLLFMARSIIAPFKRKKLIYFKEHKSNIIKLLEKLQNLSYFLRAYQNRSKIILRMDKSKRDLQMQANFGKKWNILADQTMDEQLPLSLRKGQESIFTNKNHLNTISQNENRTTPSLLFSYSSGRKNQPISQKQSNGYENYLDPSSEIIKQLNRYLPKLKVLMQLCWLISDTYTSLTPQQQIPVFQEIFKSYQTKKKFAKKTVELFKDRDQPVLDTLQEYFPQLEISSYRCYEIWKKNQIYYLGPNNKLDPDSIAKLLDFTNINDIQQFYKEKKLYRDYLEILIEKIRQTMYEEKLKGISSQIIQSQTSMTSIKLVSAKYLNELQDYLKYLIQQVTDKSQLESYLGYAYEKGAPVAGIVEKILGINKSMKEKVRSHGSRSITQRLQKQMVDQMFNSFWKKKKPF